MSPETARNVYTVRQSARALDVSDATIRNWSARFADYLSEQAAPAPGQTRLFSQDDLRVLQTVATMREQAASLEQIEAMLQAGELVEPIEEPIKAEIEPEGEQAAAVASEAFTAALQAYEARVAAQDTRIQELTERLIEAEKRSISAETELRLIREQLAEKRQISPADTPKEATPEGERVSWWDRLRGKA